MTPSPNLSESGPAAPLLPRDWRTHSISPRPSQSYAINQASEWQEIAKEAVKAVIVMLILERCARRGSVAQCLTPSRNPPSYDIGQALHLLARGMDGGSCGLPQRAGAQPPAAAPVRRSSLAPQAVMMREKLTFMGRIRKHLKFSKRMASDD